MLGRRLLLALAVGFTALTGSAVAATAQLPPPGGFRLPASNGYSLRVLSFDGDSHGEPDSVLLLFTRKGSAALYFTHKGADVTEESISADLGGLGSIDLRFVPTGKPREEAPSCEPKQTVAVDSGAYEGEVEFEGEEGFTEVHATRAPGDAHFVLNLICGMSVDEGSGGHSPGAQLRVHRRRQVGHVAFEAWKNSPTRPAHFEASIEERRGPVGVFRGISSSAGPGSFEFDVPAQSALVRPPSPFHGSARFVRPGRGPGKLQGGLSVDFPGHSNVPLAGTHGSLLRYVKNPGHQFQLAGSSTLLAWPSTKLSPIAFATSSLLAPR